MHKKQNLMLGIGALGAAVVLSGCGGSSFQKNTFANLTNTLPASYGLEPLASNSVVQAGSPSFFETSGLGSPDSKTPYLTSAIDFTVIKTVDGAALPARVDPNATGKVPLGFSIGGSFIDGANGTAVVASAVTSGTPAVFRAAIANGVANGNAPGITSVSLSSTDPEWTLGTLPMTFNDPGPGPLANGTYVTGTNQTPAPFAVPFKTSGIHTVIVTLADDAGRSTATTFALPSVAAGNVALFLQNFIVSAPTAKDANATTLSPITAGDTVTIDGGAGTGTYPTGYAATTADAQGTVVLFAAPGTHTVTETDAKGVVVQTSTFTIAADAAGSTIIDVPVTTATTTTATAKASHLVKRTVKH